jgi:hypothetical protein
MAAKIRRAINADDENVAAQSALSDSAIALSSSPTTRAVLEIDHERGSLERRIYRQRLEFSATFHSTMHYQMAPPSLHLEGLS